MRLTERYSVFSWEEAGASQWIHSRIVPFPSSFPNNTTGTCPHSLVVLHQNWLVGHAAISVQRTKFDMLTFECCRNRAKS